jgi:hypothetical protein
VLLTGMPRPQSVRGTHGDGAHHAVTQLLLDFERQPFFRQRLAGARLQLQRLVDSRHLVARELDVHYRADALNDLTL